MATFTTDETAKIGQALEQRRRQLVGEIRDELASSGEQHYIDLAGRVNDLADESVADLITEMGAAMVDRQIAEVREIEAATARLAAGNLGSCVDCGTDIPLARLLAYPTAVRCTACQAVHEKTYAHIGSPSL